MAKSLAADFKRQGFKAHVKREDIPGRGSWYRVRVGKFDSRSDAASARSKIKSKAGYDGFVTSL